MSKVMIVGATSAIAYETAKNFAQDKAELFLVARNDEKLESVCHDLQVRGATAVHTFVLDLTEIERHQELFEEALAKLGGLDAILIAHGTLSDQKACEQSVTETLKEFNINALSVISLLTIVANYMETQKRGCIAVLSSVAGDRGRQSNYVYGAAKSAVSTFLGGLRARLAKSGVDVVTVKPGFVDTPMTAHVKKNFLFASSAKVGLDTYKAMKTGKEVLYTPWFWRYILLIVKSVPEPVFKKLSI
jgi:short-subunit dehydrogenase